MKVQPVGAVSQALLIPFESLPKDAQQDITAKCLSDECQTAKTRLNRLRLEIQDLCHQAKAKEAEAWKNLATAGSLLAAAASVYGAAQAVAAIPIVGWIAAVVLYVVAAVLLVSALVFVVLAGIAFIDAANIRGQINEKNSQFIDEADNVMRSCSEYCWPDDLELPECG
jgi:Flp pilus assembly protein TadB